MLSCNIRWNAVHVHCVINDYPDHKGRVSQPHRVYSRKEKAKMFFNLISAAKCDCDILIQNPFHVEIAQSRFHFDFRLVWMGPCKTNKYSGQQSGAICAGDPHTSVQIRNNECSRLWNPGQTSPEVQNRGISGPTKRTCVPQKFKIKKVVHFT